AENSLVIKYRKNSRTPNSIPIDRIPCNYGGHRYYFKCPFCRQRMRKLYLAHQSIFLCRKCLNLTYKSQFLRPSTRKDHMTQKIKRLITDKGGNFTLYNKPPRMWRRTYDRLRRKHHYYEHMEEHESNKELRAWHGARMEPWLDESFDYKPNRNWSTESYNY